MLIIIATIVSITITTIATTSDLPPPLSLVIHHHWKSTTIAITFDNLFITNATIVTPLLSIIWKLWLLPIICHCCHCYCCSFHSRHHRHHCHRNCRCFHHNAIITISNLPTINAITVAATITTIITSIATMVICRLLSPTRIIIVATINHNHHLVIRSLLPVICQP